MPKDKKTILITGATGFLGRHVFEYLRRQNQYDLTVAGRNEKDLKALCPNYIVCDLNRIEQTGLEPFGRPDYLIHLAWEGLPNYRQLHHIETNLPAAYRFLKGMIQLGLKNLTVVGTCFEYGVQNGCLSETLPANPTTCYGIAKDSLRRFLEALHSQYAFRLTWTRLFYMFGKGQRPDSLIPSLDRAIDDGEKVFNVSSGEQLRDFLPVEDVAERIARITLNSCFDGIVNICSGKPVSIRKFVENHLIERNAEIQLNFGHRPMAAHEPVAFWGDAGRQDALLNLHTEKQRHLLPKTSKACYSSKKNHCGGQ